MIWRGWCGIYLEIIGNIVVFGSRGAIPFVAAGSGSLVGWRGLSVALRFIERVALRRRLIFGRGCHGEDGRGIFDGARDEGLMKGLSVGEMERTSIGKCK